MRRILLLLAALAASAGCATPGGGSTHHRVGSVNNGASIPAETLTLGVGTVHSQARLTTSIDTWAVNIVNATGTASGTYTIEASQDATNWFSITLPSTPPALASGSPTMIPIEYDGGWPWTWWRVTYVGTGGSGTAALYISLKG